MTRLQKASVAAACAAVLLYAVMAWQFMPALGAVKGNLDSVAPYTRFAAISTPASFGPFAVPPSEAVDALYVGNTTLTLVVTGSDGVSVTFSNVPAGTVLPISPTTVTTASAGTLALFR
jgi:hypothetical protein